MSTLLGKGIQICHYYYSNLLSYFIRGESTLYYWFTGFKSKQLLFVGAVVVYSNCLPKYITIIALICIPTLIWIPISLEVKVHSIGFTHLIQSGNYYFLAL